MVETDSIDDVLALLSGETPEALRSERLPLLFQVATACAWENAPQVALLVEKAFSGEAGLAALREQHAFLAQGAAHAEPNVRAASLSQLRRLCGLAEDVTLLREHGLFPLISAAVGDAELSVSRHAAQALIACAAAGAATLRLLLDDGPTLGVLRGLGGASGTRQGAVLQLRVLELWVEASATGEEQCALLIEREMLAPLLPLLGEGDDPLLKLNGLELLQRVCGTAAGFAWLEAAGLPRALCNEAATPLEADPFGAMQRPALLRCLGAMVEGGGEAAAARLLQAYGLLDLLWAHLACRESEVLGAALDALRRVACSPQGLEAVARRAADGGGAALQPLPALLGGKVPGATAGAYSALAQLCATAAAASPAQPAAVHEALRLLFGAASPRAGTAAADGLAEKAAGPLPEMRAPAMALLLACAALEWGATLLCCGEGVLALLLEPSRHDLGAEQLRQKHALAQALLRWPHVAAQLGAESATLGRLHAYVAAGPFAVTAALAVPRVADAQAM